MKGQALALAAVVAGVALAGCVAPQGAEPAALAGLPFPPPRCLEPCMRGIFEHGDSWEPAVAVNPSDPLHIVAASNSIVPQDPLPPHRWGYAHVSRDGGATWQTAALPGGPSAGPGHPLFDAGTLADSVVAFLPDGTLLHSVLAFRTEGPDAGVAGAAAITGYDLVVLRSSDGGLTYPAEDIRVVREGDGALAFAWADVPPAGTTGTADGALWDAQDKQWLATGPEGDVLVAWTEILGRNPARDELDYRCDMVAAHSPDGGRTWGPMALVDEGGCFGYASPLILPDGSWRVAYIDYASTELYVAASTDRGASWAIQAVHEGARIPTLKAQPRDEGLRLLLGYAEVVDRETGVQAPALRWSDDLGATWGAPVRLHEPRGPGAIQTALDVGPDGRAWATFYHPKDTEEPTADYLAVEVGDGAASPPVVLDAGIEAPPGRLGHYQGLAARPGGAFAVWVTQHGSSADLVGAAFGGEDS